MAPLFPELRPVVAALSLVASFSVLSQAQTFANLPSIGFVNNASTSSDSLKIRPAHLWSIDYVNSCEATPARCSPRLRIGTRWTGCTPASQPPESARLPLWTTLSRIMCTLTELRAKTDSLISSLQVLENLWSAEMKHWLEHSKGHDDTRRSAKEGSVPLLG